MEFKGVINITEELTLESPTATIKGVAYSWDNNNVTIEVIFKEPQSIINHSRSFTFINDTGKELGVNDIYDFVASHEVLGQFS